VSVLKLKYYPKMVYVSGSPPSAVTLSLQSFSHGGLAHLRCLVKLRLQ
jgi:hypothetical protein